MKKNSNIYVLIDLSIKGIKAVRYVGKTVQKIEDRFDRHISVAKQGAELHVSRWLRKIEFKAKVKLIEIVPSNRSWKKVEKRWIKHYKSRGCKLTNMTRGGDGCEGWRPTKKQRLENSRRIKKWFKTHEHPMKGKPGPRLGYHNTKQHNERISKANKGKPSPLRGTHHTAEWCRWMSDHHPRPWLGKVGPMRGRRWSKESRRHAKKAAKKREAEKRRRGVSCSNALREYNVVRRCILMYKSGATKPLKKVA